MTQTNDYLYGDQVRMRRLNLLYVYLIHLVQLFLNIMPPFIRNFGLKLMLGKAGKHSFFDYNLYIKFPWLVEIGDNVSINRGGQFYPGFKEKSRIVIGNQVYIAPNVCFYAAAHDTEDLSRIIGADIRVGDNVWIGANSIILPGVTIGSNSIIGAGSVVTRDIPENSVAAGSPARVIKTREII
ncbi:MAG: DapH/DapD/GlmU-related protein [Chloroflexota bacterium]